MDPERCVPLGVEANQISPPIAVDVGDEREVWLGRPAGQPVLATAQGILLACAGRGGGEPSRNDPRESSEAQS